MLLELNIDPNEVGNVIINFPHQPIRTKCRHLSITLDDTKTEIICKACDEKLNPVQWIIDHYKAINAQNQRTKENKEAAKIMNKELEDRARTKCTHCKKMTAINLNYPSLYLVQTNVANNDRLESTKPRES